MSPLAAKELRILTPVGMLGYGYDKHLFWSAIRDGVDAIILDSGSTDSGPQKLAFGSTTCPREAYSRDLEPLVCAAHKYRVPVLIGSAGGAGINQHVDLFVELIKEIVARLRLRTMKIVKIYSEVDKSLIQSEHKAGRILPCGSAVPDLKDEDIVSASCVVAQMGLEPYLKAMEETADFDIIIGGRAYDPAPYAAFCLYKGFPDLGVAYHMGKIMECGALCAKPKAFEALATVRQDSFDIKPLSPMSRCTSTSVAAHTLYEKTRPDLLVGPGGTLDLNAATYEELPDGKSVRVRGSTFIPVLEGQYTVKLEAARVDGYQSMFIGAFADPILISQIDSFLERVKTYVATVCNFDYELSITQHSRYGPDMFKNPRASTSDLGPASATIIGRARAPTQDEATRVTSATRIACIHGPYPGQKATAGNFAMLCSPQDIPLGQLCEFCIYHLMTVKDPAELFSIQVLSLEGIGNGEIAEDEGKPPGLPSKNSVANEPEKNGRLPSAVSTTRKGTSTLGDLASVIRSKNAGPHEVTFDIMFDSLADYEIVKSSGVLTTASIADLYQIPESDVIVAIWWKPALAFKATLKRPMVSGAFAELDMHASCQHVRLMHVEIPGSGI